MRLPKMANRFSSFIKRKLLGKNQNLILLDEPYKIIAYLLKENEVTRIL
jgi:hypothetical protein